MKLNKVVQGFAVTYLAMMAVPPVVRGTLKIADITIKTIGKGIKKSETIKGIKKDFDLRRQGVITVDYQVVED